MSLSRFHSNESLLHLIRHLGGLLVLGGLALGLVACDGSTVAGPDGSEADAPVSMAFSDGTASDGTASTRKAASGQRTLIDPDGNQLRLDRVEMVVREIELDRANGDENCAPEKRPDADEDDCAEVESGPVLVSLPLDGDAPAVVVDTTLPTGRWEEVEFDVHKPEAESSTPGFLEGTNFPLETSIRVQGRYTPAGGAAQDFTYTSDLNAEREIEFEPPLEVTADNTNNVTFSVNVDAWFRRADSTLVNPARVTDGGSFGEVVEENIESSIEGFEDDDRDGRDDEEEENEEDEEENENEIEIETALKTVGPDSDASGEVKFEKEADKAEFKVEVEDLTTGTYDVVVADTTRGELDVGGDDGEAEVEFRRPSEESHPTLDFDPRGRRVEVQQDGTPYLEAVVPTDDNENEDGEDEEEDNEVEIEADLDNTGPDSDAAGEVEFEKEADKAEFKVEVEDLTTGTYDVVVADTTRGELDVGGDDGEAEVEFRRPSEEGHPPLDFDPRGQRVAVQRNGSSYLEGTVPATGDQDE